MNITQFITAEHQILENFVQQNPYPEYDIMLENISNIAYLWSEYGEHNHVWCKAIYENPTNEEIIVKMGKLIYKRGGIKSLSANYYTLLHFSPYKQSTHPVVTGQRRMIGIYFQQVCSEWNS